MTRQRSLAERLAGIGGVQVAGVFMRHAAPNRDAFVGGSGGRWGESFPVIYLGRPQDSCIEEAYRHLVDESGVPAQYVKPRIFYSVRIAIGNVLDLRDPESQIQAGLSEAELKSEVGAYEACQRVAAVAHQLEYHGILAPAATSLGETLAVFGRRISASEAPIVLEEQRWANLPPRPGSAPKLRAVRS